MYYIKIENNLPVGYPIREETLREVNPSVSFPRIINAEDVLALGYAPYSVDMPPITERFKKAVLALPIFDGAMVTHGYNIVDMVEQERTAFQQAAEAEARVLQRNMLSTSDWTEMPSVQSKHTAEWIDAWAEYRTLVRDVYKQEHWPFTIDWPKEPLIAN